MSAFLDELQSVFFEEANDHIATMESTLLALERAPRDRELLDAIFRAAHSIKGSAGMFGYADLLGFTHALEELLHLLRVGSVSFSGALPDLLLRATDTVRALVDAAHRGLPPPPATDGLLREIDGARRRASLDPDPLAGADALPREVRIVFAPGPSLFRMGMDPLLVVRDLHELGAVTRIDLGLDGLPPLDELDPEVCHLTWIVTLVTSCTDSEIRDAFAFVEDVSRVEIAYAAPNLEAPQAAPTGHPAEGHAPSSRDENARSTVRVDTVKIDKLVDLVGEVVIAQSMVTAALQDAGPGAEARLRDAMTAMNRNTRELQERVMAVRMLPVGSVLGRFPRMTRDLCSALGKRVSLGIAGGEVELDKGLIEQLADPLTHLVRNAIDHGVETPEERAAANKPLEGRVSITVFPQGGGVVIEVEDDGRGLPLEKIRDKARALGLLSLDVEPTVEELHAIVFAPGFSTKDEASDVSGRGVGMDVVKRNVEAMNGAIHLTSEAGRGSKARIRVPLTMAIIDGLLLRVGQEIFVVPLAEVVESLRPSPSQLKSILGLGEVLRVRDEAVPLLRLHDLLGIRGAQIDPCRGLVCVVEAGGSHVGLLADEILAQAQVVVKPLETHFRRVDGMMGATILGDGRVALILDVHAIARRAALPREGEKERRHAAA